MMPLKDPYSPASTPELIFRQVHSYARERDAWVRGAYVCIDRENFSVTDHFGKRVRAVQTIWTDRDVSCISILNTIKRSTGRQVEGRLLLANTPFEQIRLLLTLDDSEFFNDLLFPLIEQSRPRVSLPFITSKAVVRLLKDASKEESLKAFGVKHLAARSRIQGRDEGRKVRFERIWTEESLDEALATLRDRGQWMHSAEFEYEIKHPKKNSKHVGHVSRHSTFRTKGEFEWFEGHVLQPLLKEAALTLKFYSRRSRVENTDRVPRPIVIEYPEHIFQDRAQNRRLVQALRKMERASVSVLHANPYLKASIVDFMDGSSYEVWVLSGNRIIVSPQFRATFASVERICDHIMSRFSEGELKDYDEVNV